MTLTARIGASAVPASHVLGSKLDSIPFGGYHLLIILVLLVALVVGYNLAMTVITIPTSGAVPSWAIGITQFTTIADACSLAV
jgi:nitrogen fixation protein FixH